MSPCTKSLLLRKTTITAAERAIYMLKRGNYPNPNLVTNKPKQASSCYPFFCWGFTLFNAGCHPVKNKFPWHKSIFSLEETFGELEDITGQWCSRHKCTLIDWTQSMLHRRPPFLKTWVKRQPCKQLFVMVALKMKQNTDKSLSNCCCMSRRSDVAIPTAVQLMSLARSYRQYECYRTKSPWRYVVHRGAPQWAFPLREPRAVWLFLRRCILV